MRHLLAADWVRFGRRRDLWILVALVPVILAVMFASELNTFTTPPLLDGFTIEPPDPVLEAQLRAQILADWHERLATALPAFAFPASLVKVAGNVGPLALLAIYLATALIAGEFEWGTVRTLHLASSRGRALAVRIGVVVGLLGLVAAIGLVLAAIIPFALSVEGRPLQDYAAPVPGLLAEIGIRLAVILPFIAIPVFMAILARSIGFAFLLTLLFFVTDVAVTGAPFWSTSPAPWVPALTVSGSIAGLIGGPNVQLAALVPAGASFAALLTWAVVPTLAAIARFRRLDLGE